MCNVKLRPTALHGLRLSWRLMAWLLSGRCAIGIQNSESIYRVQVHQVWAFNYANTRTLITTRASIQLLQSHCSPCCRFLDVPWAWRCKTSRRLWSERQDPMLATSSGFQISFHMIIVKGNCIFLNCNVWRRDAQQRASVDALIWVMI